MAAVIRSRRGLTLVEVMISLAVFTVLTLVFAASIPAAQKACMANGQYAQAISLCQHKIDQLRAVGYGRLNYTELSDAGIIDDDPSSQPYSFMGVDQVENYLPASTAALTIQSVGTNMLRVGATVTWKPTTYTNRTNTLTLSAIITNVE
jgi:prepilin-type N-terminal cleavage/methylation domain-containing protein